MSVLPSVASLRRALSVAGITLAALSSVRAALAAPHTFVSFDVVANDTSAIGDFVLTGAPAGDVYTSYSVSFDWSPLAGFPYSEEALWALADSDFATASTLYANPAASPDSHPDDTPVTLTWSGYLNTFYTGGGPLHFAFAQAFDGSSASWSNISITLDTLPPPPPPVSTFISLPSGATDSYSTSLAAGQIEWYSFLYTGGQVTFDTLGSALQANDAEFSDNDTEIALYSSLGGVLFTNDDIGPGNLLSRLTLDENDLAPGQTYYVALGAFDTTFDPLFGAASTSPSTGALVLNVTVIPETGTLPLALLGVLTGIGARGIARRRSKAAPV
jgi:hypothetical protein